MEKVFATDSEIWGSTALEQNQEVTGGKAHLDYEAGDACKDKAHVNIVLEDLETTNIYFNFKILF